MKIAILSRGKKLYSTQRLKEASRARGHRTIVIDPLRCYMNIAKQPTVHYNGKALDDVHAVIPRIGASVTFYGTAVVRQFEMMGVFALNPSVGISQARDKLRSLQLLAAHGIDLPVTGFASSPGDTDDLLSLVGGAPVVVKLLDGTQGRGVVLAETRQAADGVIDAFRGLAADFLVQRYVKESSGADIRCFVIDDQVVAAMERLGAEGEFRANLHRGGSARPVQITAEERAIAVRAARVVGLNVAGVDILRSNDGPLVIEVNSSPGLEGIEETTGVDVAALIVEFIEKHAAPRRARRTAARGRGARELR
jgi:ribosomal protein S6--L-glutamate ligase